MLTASLAWLVFREHAGLRIVLGMGLIVASGIVLAWPNGDYGTDAWLGESGSCPTYA